MNASHLFAGIHVSDLPAAVRWYERVAGRPADLIPNERESAWRFADGGWLCLIADRERAGAAEHTLLVEDLDETIAELQARGIATGPIEPVGGDGRRIRLSDPDGNGLALAQVGDG